MMAGLAGAVLSAGDRGGALPGSFEDPELVERLRSVGVPGPLTKLLAEALDFEFDLADDGAPGVVALILVAVALVAFFSSVSQRAQASPRHCPSRPVQG